ncbi:MAG: 3-oxoacyl-[acyl-carrier protein] reductase, partial [uncultured Microvirga sp.]
GSRPCGQARPRSVLEPRARPRHRREPRGRGGAGDDDGAQRRPAPGGRRRHQRQRPGEGRHLHRRTRAQRGGHLPGRDGTAWRHRRVGRQHGRPAGRGGPHGRSRKVDAAVRGHGGAGVPARRARAAADARARLGPHPGGGLHGRRAADPEPRHLERAALVDRRLGEDAFERSGRAGHHRERCAAGPHPDRPHRRTRRGERQGAEQIGGRDFHRGARHDPGGALRAGAGIRRRGLLPRLRTGELCHRHADARRRRRRALDL